MKKIILLFATATLLSGCMPAVFVGAAGSALVFAKDTPAQKTMEDIKISASLKARFIKQGFKQLYTKIKIEVDSGRILLTGTIDKEEDALKAVEICWNENGVSEVINELKVDKNSDNFNLVQYTRDALITSQIKSKTFINSDIKFVNYTVVTSNDVVYLFGLARSEEELEKVANIAANIHGVTKVVSHVRMINATEETTPAGGINPGYMQEDQVQVIKDDW